MIGRCGTSCAGHVDRHDPAMRIPKDRPLDLVAGDTMRVRAVRHDARSGAERVVFEGRATIAALTPLPYVARLGPRWTLGWDCLPGVAFVASHQPGTGYTPGDKMMVAGESWTVLLLDRGDPARPWGPDGPTIGEGLQMAVETFAVAEQLDGVEFA